MNRACDRVGIQELRIGRPHIEGLSWLAVHDTIRALHHEKEFVREQMRFIPGGRNMACPVAKFEVHDVKNVPHSLHAFTKRGITSA